MHQALMKATEKNPRRHLKIYVGLLIIIIAFAGLTSFLNLKGFPQDLRSRASVSDDIMYCTNQPSCCNDITRQLQDKGDISDLPDDEQPYHACDWPIRGYCQPSICNSLPSGIKYRGHCGWYYYFHDANGNDAHLGTNSPDGYGCMIGESEATMHLKYSSSGATVTPIPLASPTPLPTAIPPTSTLPTSTPIIIQPTSTPLPTQPLIPTVSPTTVIQPSVYYLSPTLPPIGGSGSPVTTNYIQPTTYNLQPSITPIPTKEPILPKIEKQVSSFFQEIKIKLSKFISNVLP